MRHDVAELREVVVATAGDEEEILEGFNLKLAEARVILDPVAEQRRRQHG